MGEVHVEVLFRTGNGWRDHCFAAGPVVTESDEEVTFCWGGRNETVKRVDIIRLRRYRWVDAPEKGPAWQRQEFEAEATADDSRKAN
jgi:hypothetical protein